MSPLHFDNSDVQKDIHQAELKRNTFSLKGRHMGRKGSFDESLETMGQRQLDDMTQSQRNAFKFYDGSGTLMNDYLRGGDELDSYDPKFASEVKKNTQELDDALNNASLPRSIEAFRGGDAAEIEQTFGFAPGDEIDTRSLIGKTYTNKGFLSSTTDRGYAEEYADPYGGGNSSGVLFHINYEKGAKAVYESNGYENQILSASKSKFKITNAYYDNDEILHIHMTGGKK